jgi:tetratricopeptide (TPR) repeat protein
VRTTAEQLAQAKALHNAGQLPAAERAYLEVLEVDSGNAEAHYLLGAARHALGRPLDAIENLEHALRLQPNYVDVHNYLGSVLARQGKVDEAIGCYRRALALRPDFALAHHNLGCLLTTLNKPDEAVVCHQKALALKPEYVEAYHGLGIALKAGNRPDEAVASYRRAIALAPEYFEAHNNLGVALMDGGKLDEAMASFQRALELNVDYAEAHYNLGVALAKQTRRDEAVACYRRAIALQSNFAEAHNALGIAMIDQGKLEEAEQCCRRAIAIRPGYSEAHFCLGGALMEVNRSDEAIVCYRQALALKPDYARAHYGLGLALLLTGRFAEGWSEYEWRWKSRGQAEPVLRQPRWSGAPLPGGTILLQSEQGLGDTLQFVRYAELVKPRVGRVIVECQPPLVTLLASCPGVDGVFAQGQPAGAFDVHAPLASLPGIFGTTLETVPAKSSYLTADAESVERWQNVLGPKKMFRIGIAWQGNVAHANDRWRSIPLARFDGLAQIAGVQLYSLQLGAGREQLSQRGQGSTIVDLGDRPIDFLHTAAIMRNLDLVITCDSSPAHLAGALGVPTWVALPFAADWRWLLGRSDSPWYPSMRLFRQSRPGDWRGVFRMMEQELAKIV